MPIPYFKTKNWRQYNNSLIGRGSLTFWIDEEAIRDWKQPKQGKRGRPRTFSDLAIATALMVKRVFSMPLRALQDFIDSVFRLADVPLVCLHYTCISRRAKDVEISFKPSTRGTIQHLAIDTSTHEIVAAELSLSGVTDGEVLPNLLQQTRRTSKQY